MFFYKALGLFLAVPTRIHRLAEAPTSGLVVYQTVTMQFDGDHVRIDVSSLLFAPTYGSFDMCVMHAVETITIDPSNRQLGAWQYT